MRFVSTKTFEQRSCLMLHRTRHLFIREQTVVINSIRAHLAKFGIVAPVRRSSRTGLKNCEPISQLSKMQKQRVGLASSLVTMILVLALITVAPRRLSCRQSLGQPCCKERLLLFL